MPIDVRYVKNENHIIQCDFSANWNDDDFDYALALTKQAVSSAARLQRCVVVFNMETMSTPSVSVLDFMGNLLESHAAFLETYVVISRDPLLTSMLQLNEAFYEYFGVQLILADSLPEALKLVGQRRASLGY